MNCRIVEYLINGRRSLLVAGLLFVVLGITAQSGAQEEKDWRFGVIEAYTARNAPRELNIGWTRVRFQWADVQAAGPDSWTPEVSDEQIDEQLADGREVLGLLIGIPDWARDEDDLPAGLWLEHDDPGNLWASFVREIVSRYDGRIDRWIIWNEPDIDASEVAHSWDGSVDDFYQLQRVAYLVAKEANPDLDVVLIEANKVAYGASGRPGGIVSTSVMHGLSNASRIFPNDLAMLAWAGTAYAVGNAHSSVLAVADHVAPPCDEDGVAQVLESIVAGRA